MAPSFAPATVLSEQIGIILDSAENLLIDPRPGRTSMNDAVAAMKVGMQVPDFDLTCYDPRAHDFTKVQLADLKKKGKWTILFFYPADFTFV